MYLPIDQPRTLTFVGEFGRVYKGLWMWKKMNNENEVLQSQIVAVKTIKGTTITFDSSCSNNKLCDLYK